MCETYIQERLAPFGTERRPHYDLDNLRSALAELDHPVNKTRCLLIGGTNGKGSTSLLLSAALREHGLRVRTYTSPHLFSLTERFLENLKPISLESLLALIEQNEALARRYSLSYFEFLTLLFFVWCRQQQTDCAVVEVGLGGALDATNVCDPIASVLTNVDLDHQEYLGPTREIILADKIQISRTGRTLYTGIACDLRPQVEAYALGHAVTVDTPKAARLLARDWSGQRLELEGHRVWLRDPSEATAKNAALAWRVLQGEFPEIPVTTLQAGFSKARFPGRFEVLGKNPRIVLCGAHNLHGVESLRKTLESLPQLDRLHVLCGFSGDKPYQEMLELLDSVADTVLVTDNPGARTPGPSEWPKGTVIEPDLEVALSKTRSAAAEGTLLVTGSLYLIGAVRKLLGLPLRFSEDSSQEVPPTTALPFSPVSGDANQAKAPASEREQNPARA
ncbi:MAG: hypothetical protein H6617_04085 [Bdellovibrionaceae bacterium]|nr:hypothetical protein [Pseudobdellovibrionaceae bacterium]